MKPAPFETLRRMSIPNSNPSKESCSVLWTGFLAHLHPVGAFGSEFYNSG